MKFEYRCPFCLYGFNQSQATPKKTAGQLVTYVCPNPNLSETNRLACGKDLPLNFFDSESIVISLSGAANSGKSIYGASLINQLMNNSALHKLGIRANVLTESPAIKTFLGNFQNMNIGKTVGYTLPGAEKEPLAIQLRIRSSNGQNKTVYLSFFDSPGEKHLDNTYMIDNFEYIYNADGLIFMFEPMQFQHLWEKVMNHNGAIGSKKTASIEAALIFENVYSLMKEAQNTRITQPNGQGINTNLFRQAAFNKLMKDQGKIKVPIALTMSKIDQLNEPFLNDIPDDMTEFQHKCMHNGCFDDRYMTDTSNEIRDLIGGEPDGDPRILHIEENFKHSSFFGIKSADINQQGNAYSLDSRGVVLPLLWLFNKLNVL